MTLTLLKRNEFGEIHFLPPKSYIAHHAKLFCPNAHITSPERSLKLLKVIDKRLKGSKQSFATLTDFQTGNNQSLNQHIGEVILIPNQPFSSGGPNHQLRPLNCKYHHEQIQTQIPKNATRDGGRPRYALFTVYTVQTGLHCLNRSMYAYIYC